MSIPADADSHVRLEQAMREYIKSRHPGSSSIQEAREILESLIESIAKEYQAENTEPCLFCQKQMPSSCSFQYQPSGGGWVTFEFGFGSGMFDEFIAGTEYRGFVCDDCAAKHIPLMEGSSGHDGRRMGFVSR